MNLAGILSGMEQNRDLIAQDERYQGFGAKANKLIVFLDSLSTLIFDSGKVKTCISGSKVHFLRTELIDSAVRTLNSIKSCCMCGSLSDANVLARKYRDDLLLFLYILAVLDSRRYLTEEQLGEIVGDGMDVDESIAAVQSTLSVAVRGDTKDDDDVCVDAWFDDRVECLPGSLRRKRLSFENYMAYLRANDSIAEVIAKCNLESNWEDIRRELNAYTHNNGRTYTQHNMMTVHSLDIGNCLSEIASKLDFITSVFVVFLILIDSTLIGSTDYVDHLDMGLEPPEDSQYWISPFVQEFIEEHICGVNAELRVFLKDNNEFGMLIE